MGAGINAWKPEEAEIAIRMFKDGKAASEIGMVLHKSRSAVMGFLHRQGVKRGVQVKNVNQRPAKKNKPSVPFVKSTEKPLDNILVFPANPKGAPMGRTPFLKAGPYQCRWVTESSPAFICGEEVVRPGCSWCAEHYAIVFIPRSETRKVANAYEFGWKKPGQGFKAKV